MNTKTASIVMWVIVAFVLLAAPLQALANATNPAGGRGAPGPLPGSPSWLEPKISAKPLSQQALPLRHQLGFNPAALAPQVQSNNTHPRLFIFAREQPARAATATTVLGLGYGSSVDSSKLDWGVALFQSGAPSLAGLKDSPLSERRQNDNLTLNLGAGISHKDLSAGIVYTQQNAYSTVDGEAPAGPLPFPSFFLSPPGLDQPTDFAARSSAGQAIFLYLSHNLSRQLNLRGTVGLGELDKLANNSHSDFLSKQSRRWGFDFTASYKLLDNLVSNAHLSYVNIDDRSPGATNWQGANSNLLPLSPPNQSPEHVFSLGGHIRMTF